MPIKISGLYVSITLQNSKILLQILLHFTCSMTNDLPSVLFPFASDTHFSLFHLPLQMLKPNVFALLLCPLVRKLQVDTRESGCYAVCRPYKNPDCELRHKISCLREFPSTATQETLRLTDGCPRHPTGNPRVAGACGPAMETLTKRVALGADHSNAFRLA